MKYIEVEKKFKLPNAEALRARLVELDAKAYEPTRQVDAYYNAPHRDFLEADAVTEWLRIRIQGGEDSINYKKWHLVDAPATPHADEYESPVGDAEAIRRLLAALDFPPLVTVDKTREKWRVPDVEIAIDTVVDAGDFVEFEFKGDALGPNDAFTRLDRFINGLNVELGEQVNLGYPHILLGRTR